MDSDWCEVHRLQLGAPELPEQYTGAPGTIAFDTEQELLWVGNECGRITSYFGEELIKYTSLRAHPTIEGHVLQFLFHEKGVISISQNSVHLCSRRGVTAWHISDPSMVELRCMSFLGKDTGTILVAGCQNIMYKVDVPSGQILQLIAIDYEYTMMKYCHYICAATSTGAINFLHPESLSLEKSWQAHSSSISHMDARNNYLVTCGSSTRPYGPPMLDILAKVFDLRKLEQLAPIPFPGGAAFVQMHPKMSTTSVVASTTGQLQVVDLMNPNTSNIHQARLSSYMVNLVLAPSGALWALADQENSIHIWGSSHKKLQFTEFMNPVEYADEVAPLPHMPVNTDLPFSSIGMPHYREVLLSAWPSDQVFQIGQPQPKIDPDILRTANSSLVGQRAPNPRRRLRNEVDKSRLLHASNNDGMAIAAPRFLSQRLRDEDEIGDVDADEEGGGDTISGGDGGDGFGNNRMAMGEGAEVTEKVPVMYRRVEIKYSKFGVDDFDFAFYNKTHYSGLETHIPNSYLNPLLQLLRYTPEIRNLALHHAASSCTLDCCMLCEMGFLFDMLEKADGQSCQATNFLKAYSMQPGAANLGTLDEAPQGTTLQQQSGTLDVKVQAATRYLLEQIAVEWVRVFPGDSRLDKTLHTCSQQNLRCGQCGTETVRASHAYMHELDYSYPGRNPTFTGIVKSTLERAPQMRAWCPRCKRYQQLETRTTVQSLPPVLIFSTALDKSPPEARKLWATPAFLPPEIGIAIENNQVTCQQGDFLRIRNATKSLFRPLPVYELVGMVANISPPGEHTHHHPQQKPQHLVAIINVSISSPNPTSENKWHLFNDFLVREISSSSALHLHQNWKLPTTLIYQIKSSRHSISSAWKSTLDTSCLYPPLSSASSITATSKSNSTINHPLDPATEHPYAGTPVGIDSEFVALHPERIQISPLGHREILRPVHLALARVSVLRASPGPLQDLPFINSHIAISDPITDYLTPYSGLVPGDLSPATSPYQLRGLKEAYKQLWTLLNLGVIFIGHGLLKDFRIINIHIPPTQVIDTVNLFYLPSQRRKLSLRFLAWYLLKEDIQGGGGRGGGGDGGGGEGGGEGHDSVEDARTAVRLWRKWEELGRDRGNKGREKVVEDVYRVGRRWGFKPPPPPPPPMMRTTARATTTTTTMMSAGKEFEGKGRVTPPMMGGGGMLAVAVTASTSASASAPPPPPPAPPSPPPLSTPTTPTPLGGMTPAPPPPPLGSEPF